MKMPNGLKSVSSYIFFLGIAIQSMNGLLEASACLYCFAILRLQMQSNWENIQFSQWTTRYSVDNHFSRSLRKWPSARQFQFSFIIFLSIYQPDVDPVQVIRPTQPKASPAAAPAFPNTLTHTYLQTAHKHSHTKTVYRKREMNLMDDFISSLLFFSISVKLEISFTQYTCMANSCLDWHETRDAHSAHIHDHGQSSSSLPLAFTSK